MCVRSKMVPVEVQTGSVKGWRETAQKLNGRRLKEAPTVLDFETPAPVLVP